HLNTTNHPTAVVIQTDESVQSAVIISPGLHLRTPKTANKVNSLYLLSKTVISRKIQNRMPG
ncbi:MAG: hypothetical protein K6T88_15715, partial [Bacillus sp. (in: Bacteria)]|nr:hypothetical protein [Bacillus sp. (in: firmicutes)]